MRRSEGRVGEEALFGGLSLGSRVGQLIPGCAGRAGQPPAPSLFRAPGPAASPRLALLVGPLQGTPLPEGTPATVTRPADLTTATGERHLNIRSPLNPCPTLDTRVTRDA